MNFKKFSIQYRKNLDKLSNKPEFNDALSFNKIQKLIPRSLKVVGSPDMPNENINCHAFTFNQKKWYEVTNVFNKINTKEIKLIDAPEKNDIIAYYLEGSKMPIIKHTGRYLGGGRVISKWTKGPIFEHGVFNVPSTYGDVVRFYRE